jgi:hypothetical protein
MKATLTIEGIRTIPPVPGKGEQYLSVNLAKVSVDEIWTMAKQLNFHPELVQISYRFGMTEIHALLWSGRMETAPTDLEERVLALADQINPKALRHVRGGWSHQVA